jgi:hypothetical protein
LVQLRDDRLDSLLFSLWIQCLAAGVVKDQIQIFEHDVLKVLHYPVLRAKSYAEGGNSSSGFCVLSSEHHANEIDRVPAIFFFEASLLQ